MLPAFITRQDTCDTDAVPCDRRDPWDCKELINEGIMLEWKLNEGFLGSFFVKQKDQKKLSWFYNRPVLQKNPFEAVFWLFKSIVFLSASWIHHVNPQSTWHSHIVFTAIFEWWQWRRPHSAHVVHLFFREHAHTHTHVRSYAVQPYKPYVRPSLIWWAPLDDGIKINVTVYRGSNQSAFVCITYYSQCISVTVLLCNPLLAPLLVLHSPITPL